MTERSGRVMVDKGRTPNTRGRLLFVNPALYAIGGMQAWLDTLLPDLEARGWEPWLGLPKGRFNDAGAYLALHPWSRTVFFENAANTDYGRTRGVCDVLSRLAPAVVVVAHGVAVLRAIEWMRWRGRSSGRVLQAIHSVEPGMFADIGRFAHVVDAVAAPNRLVQALAESFASLEPDRSLYLPYGVDVEFALDLSTVGPRIELIYAGRFEETQKRVSDVPRIVRELQARKLEWSLDVAGTGPEGERLASALASLGAAERVRFHGALPPAAVKRDLLRPGRVLLLTSRWELGPVVAWEALGRGMPLASSRFVGSGLERGIVDGATAVTFEIGDVEEAGRAIGSLASPDRRREMAYAAWRLAAERYARPVVAEAWSEALERTLRMRPRKLPIRPVPPRARGRLERWLGPAFADLARRTVRRPALAGGPGDEWPHSGGAPLSPAEFLGLAARVDSAGAV